MDKKWIKNWEEIATTDNRKTALEIIEAGYDAIDTERVLIQFISLENNLLKVQDKVFDLNLFKSIKIVGFGKASASAALALEKILGDKIKEGAIISLHKSDCNIIDTFAGTHPRPSEENIFASNKIYEIVKDAKEEDLIITIVSGGGSALLCYPESECVQGKDLYDNFLKSGKTVIEINTVRKHLSLLKGGGLAKVAYPATVIGLIFSDVPGNNFENVASGPTYKDITTVADAQKIIEQYNLGNFDLIETPKEDKYFEKVFNFVLVSNETAVLAMRTKAEELGFEVDVLSTELYDDIENSLNKIFALKKENHIILAAGEPKLEVLKKGGRGGRNLYMNLKAVSLGKIDDGTLFVSFASDGMDNSDVAGAIVDMETINKIKKLNINVESDLSNFDGYSAFEKTKDMLETGPTSANVSDLMMLLEKSKK